MTDETVYFYPSFNSSEDASKTRPAARDVQIETATCTEAESFVLRVLDNSMEPEFRRGCMIVIDPTGRATDGSYVLARQPSDTGAADAIEGFIFRQLKQDPQGDWLLKPLNELYSADTFPIKLDAVVGVVVQRAGTRRSYHKRYD